MPKYLQVGNSRTAPVSSGPMFSSEFQAYGTLSCKTFSSVLRSYLMETDTVARIVSEKNTDSAVPDISESRRMKKLTLGAVFSLCILIVSLSNAAGSGFTGEPFHKWSLDTAVKVLNSSPWAKQETFTRVIGGVGSGVSGEKEIYSTFYLRFLSARPIREAYARVQQIQHGYDRMSPEERHAFERLQQQNLDLNSSEWIVVSVSFRSNDPNQENTVRNFFRNQTVNTLKNKVYLSTPLLSQVEIIDYFPPREESIGAKFVFPRTVNGIQVISPDCSHITIELLGIASVPDFRSTFAVRQMLVDGQLVL
jgi:hypothetical protein